MARLFPIVAEQVSLMPLKTHSPSFCRY